MTPETKLILLKEHPRYHNYLYAFENVKPFEFENVSLRILRGKNIISVKITKYLPFCKDLEEKLGWFEGFRKVCLWNQKLNRLRTKESPITFQFHKMKDPCFATLWEILSGGKMVKKLSYLRKKIGLGI